MGAVNGHSRDPNAILNETSDMDRGINEIEAKLGQLGKLQKDAVDAVDASPNTRTNREIDALTADIMTLYRSFSDRLRRIKAQPASKEPRNQAQVKRVKEKLQGAIQKYQQLDLAYRNGLNENFVRQYRVVNPTATREEALDAANDSSSGGVFEQAVSVLSTVVGRF